MYGTRSNGNQHGIVLTKPSIVRDMLNSVNYVPSENLANITITEPAAGDGAFAIEIIQRLYNSAKNFGFEFNRSLSNLAFYEIDTVKVLELRKNIINFLSSIGVSDPPNIIFEEDFLLSSPAKSDIVIGNPPYVRHEKIPVDLKFAYKKKFGTFKHRSDLYIPFFEKGLQILKTNGTLCFICSNRWLKNQYGESLRSLISKKYSVDWIINMENVDAFQESVIAYPSIIKIDYKVGKPQTYLYESKSIEELALIIQGNVRARQELSINSSNWFVNQPLNGKSDTNLDLIENQNFKIGIGVATGCDKVYISDEFPGKIENELLLPILMSKDLKNDTFRWRGNYIINPFDFKGDIISLEHFPKAKKYFSEHEKVLKQRHVAKVNPQNWIKTIDKIKSELAAKPKIILPDISGNTRIFIDEGNYYPHHNLYYITGPSLFHLKVLASILMSDFVRLQLSEISNKMNGGYPRWQSQYLKKVRIPRINSFPEKFLEELVIAYDQFNLKKINSLIQARNIEKYDIVDGQLAMFEPKFKYESTRM